MNLLRNSWATDALISETEIQLDWLDRLRVLVRGSLHLRVVTETEHAPGRTQGRSRVEVPRLLPRWMRREQIGTVEQLQGDEGTKEAPPTTDELVARGMKIVDRLQREFAPAEHATPPAIYCTANLHADTHCWHWRGQPPTIYTETQADCCWCGAYRTFNYEDHLAGRAPRSLRPSGAFHGTAHERGKQTE
ncbi:MAG TPA: hypothetical protein VNM48_22485 [Chloroflexota bacterium]|nr:hypothetical protein [Chloroflexota bacterium]